MSLDPREKFVHPRIFPKDVVPIMAEGRQRNKDAEGLASNPVELASRDLAARVGLFEPGKKETLPDLLRGKT